MGYNNNVTLTNVQLGDFLMKCVSQSALQAEIDHRHPHCFLQQGRVHAKADIGVAHKYDFGFCDGAKTIHLVD